MTGVGATGAGGAAAGGVAGPGASGGTGTITEGPTAIEELAEASMAGDGAAAAGGVMDSSAGRDAAQS